MTPYEKAEEAKRLLSNPVLNEALQNIREGLVSSLEMSPMDDAETHHNVALSLQVLKRIRTQLHRFVSDQTVIEAKNKHESFIEKMRERFA